LKNTSSSKKENIEGKYREDIYCLEKVDKVSGDEETTAFKQQARIHQSHWREDRKIPIGYQPIKPKPGVTSRKLGSRIELQHAKNKEANFITDDVKKAVRNRVANPEPHQMLYLDRLYADLLSSMPMCFNLFGSLYGDLERASKAVNAWWPDIPGKVNNIRFEWSPGRVIPGRFLENRSAFDVAFEIEQPNGELAVIGIETKYHEDCKGEAIPNEDRLRRYRYVSEKSGVFKPVAVEAIIGTKLQQIWLDHLLALSMLQDSSSMWTRAKFVLVHPQGNPSYSKAAEAYSKHLNDLSTFEVRTIESLLAENVLPQKATEAFRERYIW